MAAGSPLLTSEHSKKTKPNRRKRTRKGGEAEKLDSLKWNPSSSAEDNDPFAFLVGSNELDGEIDKASYNLQIPKSKKGKPGKKLNSKKRKRSSANEEDSGDGDGDEDGRGVQKEEEKNLKNQKGKKKKKKKKSYKEEDKDAYLYYILSVHGQGRAIVFYATASSFEGISCANVWFFTLLDAC
ncbi:hypothetical protein WN944_026219 [Citrus x changshan-huyou]|uniref:Uncharacterized protein n=1 Tax=Citrus x changshan-huyou TaxID=2935761 RepID=A0AAP0LVW3_9ROSI